MNAPSSSTQRPPAAAPGPARTIGVPLIAGASLPLAFIGTGLLFLVASVVGLAVFPSVLMLPQTHPHLVAHVHLWLPGFLLTVSMGAMYQMMPVVLGTPLATSTTSAWIHLVLHATGMSAIVAGFAVGRFEVIAFGGSIVTAGVMLFARSVWFTFRAGRRRDATAWCFPLSAGWLLLTVSLGVFMAVNRRWGLFDVSSLVLLRSHAHLGLVGFFLTLLQGATFQLIPMFTMGSVRRPRLVTSSVVCSQVGLPVLATGWILALPVLTVAGAIALVASLACAGIALRATIHARTKRPLEPGIRAFLSGMVLLAAAALLGTALLASLIPEERGAVVYGLVAIPAALALAVLGMLCKIVPFLVWMRTYGPRVGRESVPSATQLGSRRLELAWYILHLAALVVLAPALALRIPALASVGAWVLAAAILIFAANVVRVLDHMRRPRTAPNPHATVKPVSP